MLFHPTKWDPVRTGNHFLEYYKPHDVWHCGHDYNYGFGNQDKGQTVHACTWGIVEYVSPQGTNGGLGNYLVIHHPHNNVWTRYLHLDRIDVKEGATVSPNQIVGLLGNSGTVSAHLHMEVLTKEGLEYVKQWTRPYGRYPVGMSKEKVAKLWKDPIKWIETEDHYVGFSPTDQIKQANNALKWATGLRKTALLRLIERLTKML